jgi:ligand-binding SRPBCC domain-containing protein
MTIHTFADELWLPRPRSEVFLFFADAANLEAITPPWVNFKILTASPVEMRVGAKIEYQIRIHGFPVRWHTEITRWESPFQFQDVQRRGPYRQWIHTHEFLEHDGGTLCRDRVDYAVWGGAVVNALFVARDVRRIFEYRRVTLERLFSARSPGLQAG